MIDKKKLFIFIALLLSIHFNGFTQFVSFGEDRPSLRWRQIQTEDFQIIYPDFFEDNAQKVANIFNKLYHHSNSLGLHPRKISVILHANGGLSNGNVALAPRKAELYTMPQQEPSDSWLEHLCVHEFRHVIQIDKVNQGLTHKLYYIFGEIFPIAMVGLYVPMWFVEGDAVCFETSIGQLGRGRSPEFLNEMKAQVVEKGVYKFYKAIVGSYKDFVPNRYTMGYFMTANSRANYGTDIWAKALKRVGDRPYGISPFSKSLRLTQRERRDSLWNTPQFRTLFHNPDSVRKANTCADGKQMLYRDNFKELQQIWQKEARAISNDFDTIPTSNKYYTNYYNPTPTGSGRLIAYKKGLQETGAFVEIGGKKEKLLARTNIRDDYKFTLYDNKIVWAEYFPNIRWAQGARNGISSYDLRTGKYKCHKSKYNRFSPFAADHQWGCVEVDDQNRASIVLLDSTFRHETARLTANKDELFIHPSFHNGQVITVVQTTSGMHLEKINVSAQTRQRISPVYAYELDDPVVIDSNIIFRASFNGNNAFYCLDTLNRTQTNILNARFGVRFPEVTPGGDSLLFSFYTSNGYKPGRIKLSEIQHSPVKMEGFRLAETVTKQENWQYKLAIDTIYPSRKYSKLAHLVNIHSWGPLSVNLNNMDVDIGAVVYSQNKLSTLSFTAGYILKSGYDHGTWMLNASYSGWWPVIDLDLESGRHDYFYTGRGKNLANGNIEPLYIDYRAMLSSAQLTCRLPLNLSAREYSRSFQPYVRYKIEGYLGNKPKSVYSYEIKDDYAILHPQDKSNFDLPSPSFYYQLLEYGFRFSNQTRLTDQEINPRWGQMLSVGYTHALLKNINFGKLWWLDSRLYFPGICRNHSLGIYGGYQEMSDKDRNYNNKILSPRGISLYGYRVSSMRSSYHMPLFYPDQNIGSILYIKGVAAAAFYDLGTERNIFRTRTYHSYGIELTADTHLFRLTYPIHVGFRTGYETQYHKMFTNLIFSIGLSI